VDRDAAVRGQGDQGVPVPAIEPALSIEDHPMPETTPEAPAATPASPPETPMPTDPTPTPAPPDPAAEATRAERGRIAGIDAAIEAARALLPAERIAAVRTDAVERGWSPDDTRRALFDTLVRHAPRPSVPANPAAHGAPPRTEVLDAMADAIAARAMPGYQPAGNGRHAEFMGWRPSDMVRELLTLNGETQIPRDPVRLAERAFHTTSDFPQLLSAAANKMLLAAYQPAAPTYRQIFLRRDFRDFKPHRHLRIGDFPVLQPLLENGEIQAGTMSESQEIVLLQTFARRIRVTRQMLVNDDLGAFTDFAAMIGRRVADFENATAYALVNLANGDGPTLTTGNAAVFGTGAARANKAAAGTALSEDHIGAGRTAIMRQRSLDGLPISLGRSMRVLVGPALELAALRLTTSITPAIVSRTAGRSTSDEPFHAAGRDGRDRDAVPPRL
jgi:hypothetical protein